jgi:hypothetical protein
MKRALGLLFVLLLVAVPATWAQVSGGNIYGNVADASGAVLPGATVTVASPTLGGAPRTTTADQAGEFRFLNLDHGTYNVTVSLQGFATVTREVIVNTGVNVTIGFALKVAGLQEAVSVTAETPVVDTKRVGTATTFSHEELADVPQGRDPWAVLKAVPGVLVDRVSVAGNEAGQQSLFVAKGSQQNDTMWNLDGIVITDTTSYGASSMYFDFDAFDEINVTTGGNDLRVPTGGIGLNFVTKRGTNAFHGSARDFFSNHKAGESTNVSSGLAGTFNGRADSIQQINDYGFDLGGPIVKDKLWFWGSYGKNDIRLFRYSTDSPDKTLLKSFNGKLNWQASPNDMVSFFYFNDEKDKFGRDPGYTGHDSQSFLWNQGSFYATDGCGVPCSLHGLFKFEINHTFSPSLFVNAKYAYFGWGYGFDPIGGSGQGASINHITDSATGSWVKTRFLKPWHTANIDGEYFADGLGGRHEVKFGFAYRHWPNTSSIAFSGNGLVGITNSDGSQVAWVTRPFSAKFTANNGSVYAGDTYTRDRLTVNAGLRFDHQSAFNNASTAVGNPVLPNLLPTLSFDGNVPGISWNDISPRVGVTIALDQSRKTIARASYARYAGQLGPLDATYNSPIAYGYTYLAYNWIDRNGDGFAQPDEVLSNQGVLYASNVNPSNPTSLSANNSLDPNYHANHDNEFVVGIEREIAPNFSLGAAYTYRRGDGLVDWTPRVDANGNQLTSADYAALTAVSAGGFTVIPYAPDASAIGNNSRILTNRPDYYQTYSGLEVTANKRLANKWLFRSALTLQSWTEHFGPNGFQNPSATDLENFDGNLTGFRGPGIDGGIVANKSYGAHTNTFFNATWQLSSSALYQMGAGFELGAALFGRQGYPKALEIRSSLGADGTQRLVVGPLDLARYDSVWDLDLRLGKTVKLGSTANVQFSVDAFNVLNSGTSLANVRQVNSTAFGNELEVLNPRILRFGIRLGF